MDEEFQDILAKIGLTKQESRVYLALLKLQKAQTGLLCKETKIASSNIYTILDSLKDKGLVSYRILNNIKVFMPAPPETLNELFLEKQRKLEEERQEVQELISKLKISKINEPESTYKYYEGVSGIKGMWHEIILLLPNLDKSTIIRVYAGKKESYEKLLGFYKEYQKARKHNKLKQRLILPHEEIIIHKFKEFKDVEVKYKNLKNSAEWGVVGDMFFIQYITTKTPRGFLIKDDIFAQTFSQTFDQLWETAKK